MTTWLGELDLLHRKGQRPNEDPTATATNEGPIKNPQIMTLTRLD